MLEFLGEGRTRVLPREEYVAQGMAQGIGKAGLPALFGPKSRSPMAARAAAPGRRCASGECTPPPPRRIGGDLCAVAHRASAMCVSMQDAGKHGAYGPQTLVARVFACSHVPFQGMFGKAQK